MSSDEKVYYGVLDTETTTATDHLNCEPEDHPALTSPLSVLSPVRPQSRPTNTLIESFLSLSHLQPEET